MSAPAPFRQELERVISPSAAVLDRRTVGTPAEVAAVVARSRKSGRLVAMTEPRRLADGRVTATLTLLAPPAWPARSSRIRRRVLVAAAVVVPILAVLSVMAWIIGRTVAAIPAHLPHAAGALLLLAVVAVFLRPGHKPTCPGLHCGGCKGGH